MIRTFAIATLAVSIQASNSTAQDLPLDLPVPTPGVTGYAAAIPRPEDVIGHRLGDAHTRPDQIVTYFESVAGSSDRVMVGWHGNTYEHRPLVHAFVSSPANLARLAEIRAANSRLSDDAAAVTDAEMAGMPTIVYLGYSVHGNEASGSEAALLLLYHLAAGEGTGIEQLLENVVVILDPSLNPDGRDRFTDWANRNRGRVPTADRADREHNEPWPGGRTNHYFFDLNRDWLPAQLPESQGRLELFHGWRPQLLADFHEMGGNSTFFFQPGVPSRGNPNTPQRTFDLTADIAGFHAEYLDRIGSLYYSQEGFDDFYYGKGSTYPDVNGAVGILFEQASSRALVTETNDGRLTYAFTIRNHFTASLSTLQAAVTMRDRLLQNQRDFYREAVAVARALPAKAYVFGSPEYPTRTQALVEVLLRHRVRVYRLGDAIAVDGVTFEPGGTFIVPTAQPQVRLIKSMMERVTEFGDSLFYDVSTWTLPLAFGVPNAEVRRDPGPLLGGEITAVGTDGGRIAGGDAVVAYAFEWGRFYGARALLRLQQAHVPVRVSMAPFSASTDGVVRSFRRGTIIVPVTSRDGMGPDVEELRALMETIADTDEIEVFPLRTGLTPSGVDLGSGSARLLEEPRVALLAGSGTGSGAVGEAWHLLNERMGLPVSLIDVAQVDRTDLSRYNTVIMTGYYSGLSEDAVSELTGWVRGGGLLIAMGSSSVSWVLRQELVPGSLKETPSAGDGDTPYADMGDLFGAQYLSGAILEGRLDTTHPLAYGHPARVAFFKSNRSFLELSDRPGVNVSRFGESALLSGYVSEEINALVANSANIMAARSGGGRVVLFTEDLAFRGFWYGTSGLFLNAVFFGSIF